jgi:SAM-dependent MidA family methyltransferase
MLSRHTPSNDLPVPSDDALQVSAALAAHIRGEIDRAGGWIDFARYMELALYTPGLGYYRAGSTKFGAAGDFVTAPEISSLLGRALAATLRRELQAFDSPTILELGAGSGALAAQLLDALAALGESSVSYRILERSAQLKERQREELGRFGERVSWLDALPTGSFAGAIVANEVLDALPVSCFVNRGGQTHAVGVAVGARGFCWAEVPASPALAAAVSDIQSKVGARFADGYRSEVCLALPAWIDALGACLQRGCLLFADYGLARREYYHEQRDSGTLICHYRHRAHTDPFLYPGLQDLSAWVDFSACAEAAAAAGLAVAGYTTQGQYLLSTLADARPPSAVDAGSIRELSALKTLIFPGEMGERFKILLLRKDAVGAPLPGRDFRDRL